MIRRFRQEDSQKQILATLREKTGRADLKLKLQLAAAREKNNELIDLIFESLFTIAVSYGMSAIGFKTAAYFFNSTSVGDQLIQDERMAAALPWMQNFMRTHPGLSATQTPASLFRGFQEIIASWDAELVGKSPEELIRLYGQGRELLSQAIAFDISKLIGTENSDSIRKFYDCCVYANKQGIFVFELKLSYLLTLSVPFLRHSFIEPRIKPLLHKLYNLRYLSETPLNELRQNKAKELLENCDKERILLEKLAKAGVWFNYILAAGAIASIIYRHQERQWPSPELMIFISATFMKVMIQAMQNFHEKHKQITLEKKISSLEMSFKNMLSFTRGQLELHRGKSLSDCYMTFRALPYENLSDVLVNQVVKNTLSKNGIYIIDTTQTTHSFSLKKLSVSEASTIVTQIKDVLNLRISIKMYGASRSIQSGSTGILAPANPFINKPSVKSEETVAVEPPKDYFVILKRNDEVKKQHAELEKLFNDITKRLNNFTNAHRFYTTQTYILANIQEQYNITKIEEFTLLNVIKANPTRVIPQDIKAHIHIVRRKEVIKKHLSDMQKACHQYEIERENARATLPQSRAASPNPASVTNFSGTLYAPTANEKVQYDSYITTFVYRLINSMFCQVEDTHLGKTIQINALLFDITEFMKMRAKTHALLRKDPSESFSQYIVKALSYSKNIINKDFSSEAITLLHAEVIEFSRAIVEAIHRDNYTNLENTNTFCAKLLNHARDLDVTPEVITDDAAQMLITGTLIHAFQTYTQPLPDGMLLSAFRMVNLQAEVYDGYAQPLTYLEHLAENATKNLKIA